MTFSYSLALTSNKDKVRMLILDNVDSGHLLEDEEINAMLTLKSNDLFATAAACLRSIAAKKALVARMRKAGDYSESLQDISKNLLEAARAFEDESKNIPSEALSSEILTDFNYRTIIRNKSLRGEEL